MGESRTGSTRSAALAAGQPKHAIASRKERCFWERSGLKVSNFQPAERATPRHGQLSTWAVQTAC